jgi:hypothetical protein
MEQHPYRTWIVSPSSTMRAPHVGPDADMAISLGEQSHIPEGVHRRTGGNRTPLIWIKLSPWVRGHIGIDLSDYHRGHLARRLYDVDAYPGGLM